MGAYLSIPGVIESQELQSLQRDSDGVTFHVSLDVGTTAIELMDASRRGSRYDLIVLTIEPTMILALDDVYVTSTTAAGGSDPYFGASLEAREVRQF